MSLQEIGDYILLKTLGVGSTGKVKLVQHKITQKFYAMKILKKHNLDDKGDLQTRIQREISLMQILDHPHILKINDVCESPKHFYIILEYASHGELLEYLIDRDSIDEITAIRFFRQIIYGIDYLHSHSICHRDLKLENILLDEQDNVKIGDFGFARWMKTNIAETSCGSLHYAAPEVVKGTRYDGGIAGVWSCGVVLYSLIAGKLPFEESSMRKLVIKIKKGEFNMPDFSDPIKDLISKILTVEPSERITIEQIKHHPAFTSGFPGHYIVPRPLPLPDTSEPINIDNLDPGIIRILNQIGFTNNEELKEELESSCNTIQKAFVKILLQNISINLFPWPFEDADRSMNDNSKAENTLNENTNTENKSKAEDNSNENTNTANQSKTEDNSNENTNTENKSKAEDNSNENSNKEVDNKDGPCFDKNANSFAKLVDNEDSNESGSSNETEIQIALSHDKSFDDSSGSFYSFAEPSPWASNLQNSNDENVISSLLLDLSFPLETIFTQIQITLNSNNFEWFYPNEYLVICRNTLRGIYATIRGIVEATNSINLEYELIDGNHEKLNYFTSLLTKSINNCSQTEENGDN